MMTEAWVLRKSMEALKPFERRLEISSFFDCCATAIYSYSCQACPILYQVVAGLFALGEPFGEQLGAAARTYVLSNFSSCAQTEPFARWPQKVALVADCEGLQLVNSAVQPGVALGHHFSPIFFLALCNFTDPPGNKNSP